MNKKELLKACEELIDRKLQMKEERKVVIHTKTKEQLIKVLEIFEKKGWKWWNGDLPTENINVWESFNVTKNTYIGYEDNFGYSNNYEIYKYLCYKIISFEEFLKREGLEDIDKKLKEKEEVVIHIKTQEQFKRVMEIFGKKGWKWLSGNLPTYNETIWNDYEENTCIRYEKWFRCCNLKYYKEKGYKIISFEEFLKREGLEEKPKPIAGDFIEIEGCLCLLVGKANWHHPKYKGKLAVVMLKHLDGCDWMELANGYQEYFEEGDYKPLSKEEGLRRLAK